MIEDMVELPLAEFEQFTLERLEDEEPMLIMGFSEDDLVLIHSISRQLLDLSMIMGSEPPIEITALEYRMDEALHQLCGDED